MTDWRYTIAEVEDLVREQADAWAKRTDRTTTALHVYVDTQCGGRAVEIVDGARPGTWFILDEVKVTRWEKPHAVPIAESDVGLLDAFLKHWPDQ
jgi:hypothetical protein